MLHDEFLESEFDIDMQELLQSDNLSGMSFRDGARGVAHSQRLASSSNLVHPVSVVSVVYLGSINVSCRSLDACLFRPLVAGLLSPLITRSEPLTLKANTRPPLKTGTWPKIDWSGSS